MKSFLDFSNQFDVRMTYPSKQAAPKIGDYDGIFVETEKFPFHVPVEGEDCAFLFRQKPDGADGMRCLGQTVSGENSRCQKIAFAGFGIWGPALCERFVLRFTDGKERSVYTSFSNLTMPELDPLIEGMEVEGLDLLRIQCSRILFQLPASRCNIFMYYNVFVFPEENRLREIICPDNDLLILSAITAECSYR